jgi:hypothetical protein
MSSEQFVLIERGIGMQTLLGRLLALLFAVLVCGGANAQAGGAVDPQLAKARDECLAYIYRFPPTGTVSTAVYQNAVRACKAQVERASQVGTAEDQAGSWIDLANVHVAGGETALAESAVRRSLLLKTGDGQTAGGEIYLAELVAGTRPKEAETLLRSAIDRLRRFAENEKLDLSSEIQRAENQLKKLRGK